METIRLRRAASSVVVLLGFAAVLALDPPPAPAATASPARTAADDTVTVTARTSDHVRPAHGSHTWKTVERMVPVKVGPNDDIAIDLDTTLYVPDNASPAHPQPTILMTHGFGLSKDAAEVVSTARFFAANGYVVLTFTSSGFGESGGCITLQSAEYDVKGASQLITEVL